MAAERNMATTIGCGKSYRPTGPGSCSGQGLELLQLSAHLIDRLIELLHPFLQQRINRSSRWSRLELGTGARINLDAWLPRGLQPQRLGKAALAATIRLTQQPPTQAGSTEYGSTKGAQQEAAAGAGWALLWFSHGCGNGSLSP
jgi:hypothetical protein